jgi:hypothetical protein
MQFVQAGEDSDPSSGQTFVAYHLLEAGENWLLENQNKLHLKQRPDNSHSTVVSESSFSDDDAPF